MPLFQYVALSPGGQRVTGVLSGASEQAVLAELESRQLTPVEIRTRAEAGGSGRARRVGGRRLGEAYEQLSDLLGAGVPLLRGLKLLGGQKSRGPVGQVFRDLAEAVEKGADFAAAMEQATGVFPTVHVAMIRAGERGGFLEQVLARLGRLVVKQADLTGKVIGNLIYPGVLCVTGVGIGAVIFGVFVPKFRGMFARLGDDLPGVTKFVFFLSDVVTAYAPVTGALLVALAIGAWRLSRNPRARRWGSRALLRIPVVGNIVRGFATARFCGLLGTMLSNSVPLLSALQIARDGVGHRLLAEAVDEAAEAVRRGEALSPPLARSGMFEEQVVEMLAVGESANNLDEVLVKVADTIESRLDRQLMVAVRLIEPLLLLMLAGVVAIVAFALLLPMSQLSSAV
ncbi:MAG: type II secretion system F family protein [Planctomycetota bacterium]|nr:type II secretion system F family protein [Planctomycetota bacterium]